MEVTGRLRQARAALLVSFLCQGVAFALLVTRIPAIQHRYGVSDALLPVFLAAVPVLAGAGSIASEHVVRRTSARAVLRTVQPLVCLSLVGVGAGDSLWQLALSLAAFGLMVGALDASMNMLGVGLQHRYGRSIMLGFHAAFSLGGIMGASLAWAGAHWHLTLLSLFGGTAAVLIPVSVAASLRYAGPRELAGAEQEAAEAAGRSIPWRPLLPLCFAMAAAYIADATVSNWSAKYLQDTLHSSEELATVPYNAYMVTMLLGRALGDTGVQRWGAVAVVRAGALLSALGFAVAAVAPEPWTGILGFTLLGVGLCAIVPQVFAAGGRRFPEASDAAVARLNLFNYVGFLIGSPLVGAVGDASSYRVALAVPLVLVLTVLAVSRTFAPTVQPAPAAVPTEVG
ncbi:MFS transporter [Peterkaempfera griseoplana]|uniref:MFS transporter n=1 Tax=Peterkaempfera griseoplana TaxID=66896 RepID=UPI0006E3F3A3|nr:MFS transporter [Peterkaempfera griseoplana]